MCSESLCESSLTESEFELSRHGAGPELLLAFRDLILQYLKIELGHRYCPTGWLLVNIATPNTSQPSIIPRTVRAFHQNDL